jgi:hypothetical protein
MTTSEKARKLMVEERQHEAQVQENVLSRAVEAVESGLVEEAEAKARELMVEERQQEEHIQENMLSRATEAIK